MGYFSSTKKRLNQTVDLTDVTLSSEQQKLFDTIEKTSHHMYITGRAGTGKSMLLQYFKQNSKKSFVVVAPTGVAALNVGGQTIHSFFRIPPFAIDFENLRVDPRTRALLKKLDTVVIDEVSMVRADLMDAIDMILQIARESDAPFGGVQMVLFGDLYQLPPVINDAEMQAKFEENNGGFYFFNAHAWRDTELEIYELTTNFRQKDEHFRGLLDAIRTGELDEEVLGHLNKRSGIPVPGEGIIVLATTNKTVNDINSYQLGRLEGKLFEFKAAVSGAIEPSAYPTDDILRLKKGAQVMMLRNDKDKRWANGTLGIIEEIDGEKVTVNIDGITHTVNKEVWNKIKFSFNKIKNTIEEEVVSSFAQLPMRLAWAITVHKSQGQTYNAAVIDMGNRAFAHGQTYVALSRCKSLEGVFLQRPINPRDIIVDPAIIDFMNKATVLEA